MARKRAPKKLQDEKGRLTKAGASKLEVLARKRIFVRAYLANGRNGKQAAISAGYSEHSATVTASRLLAQADVRAMVDEATRHYEKITELDAQRTLQEVARIAYFDPARAFHEDGTPKHILDMDPDTRAAVASEKTSVIMAGDVAVGTTTERRFHDKNAALEKAMKFHGHYEADNQQRNGPSLSLKVVFV